MKTLVLVLLLAILPACATEPLTPEQREARFALGMALFGYGQNLQAQSSFDQAARAQAHYQAQQNALIQQQMLQEQRNQQMNDYWFRQYIKR